MTRLTMTLALLSTAAFADDLQSNVCLSVDQSCVTDDGTSGTCVEVQGALLCQPAVEGVERRVLPWIGAGLAFVALCAGMATRPASRETSPT